MFDISKLNDLWIPEFNPILVAESSGDLIARGWHWTERHLQCVWWDDKLRPELLNSDTGKEVIVKDPGRWNLEAGPDFIDAVIQIDGKTVRGNVEIHIRPTDWNAHQHGEDLRYADVVLHVTWFPSFSKPVPPHITSVSLREALLSVPGFSFDIIDLSAYPHSVLPGTPRPCGKILSNVGSADARAVLESAGLNRLRRKSVQMALRLQETGSRTQVFYEEFMRALGYKANSGAMRAVAEQMPLGRLCAYDNFLSRYALLLGTAGLLPQKNQKTRSLTKYERSLWDEAWKMGVADSPRRPTWQFSGVRPLNHPRNRLAVVAILFDEPQNLLTALSQLATPSGKEWAKEAYATVAKKLDVANKSTLDGTGIFAKIGIQRMNAILINVLLPLLMAEGRADAEMCRSMPAEASNQQIRDTAFRLFGRDHNPAIYSTNGLRMQVILEICNAFCLSTKAVCDDCAFAQALANTIRPE